MVFRSGFGNRNATQKAKLGEGSSKTDVEIDFSIKNYPNPYFCSYLLLYLVLTKFDIKIYTKTKFASIKKVQNLKKYKPSFFF